MIGGGFTHHHQNVMLLFLVKVQFLQLHIGIENVLISLQNSVQLPEVHAARYKGINVYALALFVNDIS